MPKKPASESQTVEGRLADQFGREGARLILHSPGNTHAYALGDHDRQAVVDALRVVATAKEEMRAEDEAKRATLN